MLNSSRFNVTVINRSTGTLIKNYLIEDDNMVSAKYRGRGKFYKEFPEHRDTNVTIRVKMVTNKNQITVQEPRKWELI